MSKKMMWPAAGLSICRRGNGGRSRHLIHAICYAHLMSHGGSSLVDSGRCLNYFHSAAKNSSPGVILEDDQNTDKANGCCVRPVSFSKIISCLPDESPTVQKNKVWPRIELENGEDDRCSIISNRNESTRNSTLHGTVSGDGLFNGDGSELGVQSVSLARSLACLPDETSSPVNRKERSRMELKRSIEMRIKKRCKEQYLNGKFYGLMEKVIANESTLEDSFDIIRLNSNVDLAQEDKGLCFVSMVEQLKTGNFDIEVNTSSFLEKNGRKECLVLPNLKLRVIQEAIRVILEVVYRPHFSRISHGCRSGRGHRSALRYIAQEIGKANWWFTLHMKKKADADILSNLLSKIEEKIEDTWLFSIIQQMFDAKVLNLEFGGFPKGQGLPQEGVLSPILMNIYLDNLDSELFRMFMRYEGFDVDPGAAKDGQQSKLRLWFRRQMKSSGTEQKREGSYLRLHACRYMDEVIIGVSGSREITFRLKNEIETYLRNSLYIQVDDRTDIVAADSSCSGVQFLGMVVRASAREAEAMRVVHKLKDKVQLFAAQKQEVWEAGMVRIGKKWLAHGLKRIKESEIKQLGLSTPMLDKISHFRKVGMKTEHWYKSLIKIWLQNVNAKAEASEEAVLAKYVAEPALPHDLRDSFYNFQKCAEEYVSSEIASTLALMSDSNINTEALSTITKMEAPICAMQKKLLCYGLVNSKGFPRHVSALLLQDDILIVHWFSGLVRRWLRWYSEHDNFKEVKFMMVEYIKKSCIKTLAAKHRMHESLIEKRFELELNSIPLTEDLETDAVNIASNSTPFDDDEALMYGISYSGLCMLSLAKVEMPTQSSRCFVMGCSHGSPNLYTLHVKEQQKFPGWKTGFSTSIHLSLNGKKIVLCNHHVKDLYVGHISLQSVDFAS